MTAEPRRWGCGPEENPAPCGCTAGAHVFAAGRDALPDVDRVLVDTYVPTRKNCVFWLCHSDYGDYHAQCKRSDRTTRVCQDEGDTKLKEWSNVGAKGAGVHLLESFFLLTCCMRRSLLGWFTGWTRSAAAKEMRAKRAGWCVGLVRLGFGKPVRARVKDKMEEWPME